jgi:hypothetical protein
MLSIKSLPLPIQNSDEYQEESPAVFMEEPAEAVTGNLLCLLVAIGRGFAQSAGKRN